MSKTTKPNVSELSRKHGVSRATLIAWRDQEGIALGDDTAVRARVDQVAGKAGTDCKLKVQRLRKLTAEADRIMMENTVRAGQLIDANEVRESILRVVSAARGELLKLPSDLAPRVEGLPAAQVQAIIRDEIFAVLTRLSDSTSDLYAR
jgi:transposase-like protein